MNLFPRPVSALLLALTVFFIVTGPAFAQYFGQNKVNYRDFEWYYLKTENFDIYYPKEYYETAEFTGWEAEEALVYIEDSFNYNLEGRISFVVFPSHNSFQNNNVSGGTPSESTGGFTEFLKNRVVIPYQGSNDMFRHVIHHELTHAVMLRMLYGEGVQSILTGISRLPLPLWFIEGIAEYESRYGWSNEASMYLRDAIINDYLMPLDYLQGYFIYKGGQSVLYFLEERYGPEKVGELLRKVRSRRNFAGAVKETLGYDIEELSERWHKHLKRQIWPTAAHFEDPEDFAVQITDHEEWYNFVNTSPALSPAGDRLVMLSDKDDYLGIYLVNTVTGEIEEKLVSGGGGVYVFEQLLWLRPWIDWNPDGTEIVFVAEEGGEDVLYTLDVNESKITQIYKFGLDGVFSPSWSPDGDRIVFSGYADGQTDLYMIDVGDEESIRKVTDDRFSDYDPDWGPDGRILFVSDRSDNLEPKSTVMNLWDLEFTRNDIYMYDLGTDEITRLTNDEYEDRSPSWTPRENTISFVSDRSGAYNLYLMNLEDDETWATSDVLTGVFTPSWDNNGSVAFASFFNGGYDVYLYKNPFDEERRSDPSLTFYQQKQRGLIDNTQDLEDRMKAVTEILEEQRLNESREVIADSALVSGPVQPGSPEERDIMEALGDTLETRDEMAVVDTLDAEGLRIRPDAQIHDFEPSDEMLAEAESDTVEIDTVSADTMGMTIAEVDTLESDTTEVDTSGVQEERVRLVSGTRERPTEGSGTSYRDHIFYPPGWQRDQQEEEEEVATVPPDSIFNEEGRFIPRKYKLKFSPDIVSAAAGYSEFFGLQGYGQIMISDVLGNHVIFVGTDLYYNFENSNLSLFYYHLPERWDFGGGVFHNVYFFDGGNIRDRNWGGTGTISYPFSRTRRADFSLSLINIDRDLWDYGEADYVPYEKRHFLLPSLAYVYDNTLWGWTGPINGARYRVGFSYSPSFDNEDPETSRDLWGLDFQTVSLDARKYFHVGLDYAFALRYAGAASFGDDPQKFFLGGVSNWINRRFQGGIRVDIDDIYFSGFATPLRGSNYYEDVGNYYSLVNAEFRFPLIRQLLFGWPLPFYFSNIRGAVYTDLGAAWGAQEIVPGEPDRTRTDPFNLTYEDEYGNVKFDDFHAGFGWGVRLNLGFFLLKWDMAWKHEYDRITQPRYYVSLGADI